MKIFDNFRVSDLSSQSIICIAVKQVSFEFIVFAIWSFFPMAGILFIFLGALASAAWIIFSLCCAMTAVAERCWRSLFVANLILICGLAGTGLAIFSGDYFHLAIMLPFYSAEISSSPGGWFAQKSFDWGLYGFVGGGARDRQVVYDPTGSLAADERLKKATDDAGVTIKTTHFIGRFYIIQQDFP